MRMILWMLLLPAFCPPCLAAPELHLSSPGRTLSIAFTLDPQGTPRWQVAVRTGVVLSWSQLGLTFRGKDALTSGFVVADTAMTSHDEAYTLVVGKTKHARDTYRQLRVTLRESAAPRRRLEITFRAYDDGAAFRYTLPVEEAPEEFEIVQENTQYHFPGEMNAWAFQINTFRSSYEGLYLPTTLSAIPDTGLVYPPLTLQRQDGLTLALTEADLTDYAGMYFRGLTDRALQVVLAPWPDGSGVCVRGRTPFSSPWRVIMIGGTPGALIESTIIQNLSAPCAEQDVTWIRPGKAVFPWWPNFFTDRPGVASRLDFENQKYYIDFAAENSIPYLELEPPWYGDTDDCIQNPGKYDITRPVPELQLPALFAYARTKGVRLLMWAHWENVDRQANEAFPLYARWGAAGVKIDFMNRDDQQMIRWYQSILKKTAEHRLMVYFHGAYKPTGTQRTYPHLLTQEGVLGNEQNKVISQVTPEHTVTLPFTRMLCGPMDFTPGGFRNVTTSQFKPDWDRPMVMGTRCRQLAMFVVYESPLTSVCDDPATYRGQPGLAFIRNVPTTWDATRVIDGRIADYIVIARKSGNDWYLGAMTDASARTANIPLSFLGRGRYLAEIFQDGTDADTHPTSVVVSRKTVTATGILSVRLAQGGGLAIRFAKKD